MSGSTRMQVKRCLTPRPEYWNLAQSDANLIASPTTVPTGTTLLMVFNSDESEFGGPLVWTWTEGYYEYYGTVYTPRVVVHPRVGWLTVMFTYLGVDAQPVAQNQICAEQLKGVGGELIGSIRLFTPETHPDQEREVAAPYMVSFSPYS